MAGEERAAERAAAATAAERAAAGSVVVETEVCGESESRTKTRVSINPLVLRGTCRVRYEWRLHG